MGVATSGAAAGMAWVHVAHPASQPHTHGDAHSKAGRDRRGVGDVETNNTHNEDDCEAHNATQQSPQALAKARTRTRAARGGRNARCLTQGVRPPSPRSSGGVATTNYKNERPGRIMYEGKAR